MKTVQWVAGSIAVVAVAHVAVAFFTVDVCDQQLAGSGAVVTICRHPQMSDPPIAALGVLVLAALGFFFTEISGFGFTLKRTVEAAAQTAQDAARVADEARESIKDIEVDVREGVGEALSKASAPASRSLDDLDPIDRLAARYNEIRWTTPSGSSRDTQMSDILDRMTTTLRDTTDFDVAAHLRSTDAGKRLAAVAYIDTHPDPQWIGELVNMTLMETKAFNETRALRTLRRLIEGHCDRLTPAARQQLQRRQSDLRPTSGRANEIRQLLAACPPSTS